MIHLVTGGLYAGKSAFVRQEVDNVLPRGSIALLSPAPLQDPGWVSRFQNHQNKRSLRYTLVEEPLRLGKVLSELLPQYGGVIVDSLSVWMANLVGASGRKKGLLEEEEAAFLEALSEPGSMLWLVSNEVGMGMGPDTAVGRRYREALGDLNRRLAARADRVSFLVSGLPLRVK